MRQSLLRSIRVLAILLALAGGLSAGPKVMACPNCKFANETESNRPRAYMYSILFMIGMPATIFTGFGLSFYRMVKKAHTAASEIEAGDTVDV